MNEFERAIQLNDNVMRSLTLKIDPRLVDHLVAPAKGETPVETPEEDADKTAEATKEVVAE